MHGSLEIIHWLGTTILIATIVVQILPPPTEIPGAAYLVLYNTVRRIASLKIDAAWKDQQVLQTKTTAVVEATVIGDRKPKEENKP